MDERKFQEWLATIEPGTLLTNADVSRLRDAFNAGYEAGWDTGFDSGQAAERRIRDAEGR